MLSSHPITYEDKSSTGIPRIPSALLTASRPEYFTELPNNNQSCIKIPVYNREICLARQIIDPTIVNTPPSEFMNSLKERLCVYFCDTPISR